MKRRLNGVAAALLLCGLNAGAGSRLGESGIDLSKPAEFEILKMDTFSGKPDAKGVLKSYGVQLPAFAKMVYFGTDGNNLSGIIPSNRSQMWVLGADYKLENTPAIKKGGGMYGAMPSREGTFSVFLLKDGRYLAVLPLVGEYSIAYLTYDYEKGGAPTLSVASFGKAPVKGEVPVLAYATGSNIYEASATVWQRVIKSDLKGVTAKLRDEKKSPECWDYLGWCSWEEYRFEITEELLAKAMKEIDASDVPVRWVLIDEGTEWFDSSKDKNRFNLGLYSFKPDPVKWPNGLAPLMQYKREDGIKWMGIWHHQAGLFRGIDPDNNMGPELNKLFVEHRGETIVKGEFDAQYKFYEELFREPTELGFDFIKVDFQGSQFKKYVGGENAVQAHLQSNRALEAYARDNGLGLMHCFAQDILCVLNGSDATVIRTAQDYRKGKPTAVRVQTFQNYNNKLWQGHVFWGDHDMFHSNDTLANRMMAVSKAMAGAPVYVSDPPEEFVEEVIVPLCYKDGKLIKPLAPSIPLPESFFNSPINEKALYRTIAPLANGAASIACYNLYDGDEPVTIKGTIKPSDYKSASAMMQPYPGEQEIPAEGLYLFDWYEQTGTVLDKEYAIELTGLADTLVHLCPIRQGWAVVGLTGKYLSPATVLDPNYSADEVSFLLVEGGELALYLKNGKPEAEGLEFTEKSKGLWVTQVPDSMAGRVSIKRSL